jgi:hypothetical protein
MKRYTFRLISGIAGILLCLCLFNWFINPYDIFQSPVIKGLNSYKSEVSRHTRLSKVYRVNRVKPDVILLASSRGLAVPESLLSDKGMRGLNLSLTSASTYELLRMMQHAQAVHPLKKAILALDESFTGGKQSGFLENRLSVNYDNTVNKEAWLRELKDRFQGLLSADALRASIRTIMKQDEDPESKNAEHYRAQRIYEAGGHRQMFRNMEASMFSKYKGDENRCMLPDESDKLLQSENFIYFKKIIEMAYKEKIDLVIYFSPVHARLYEAECMVGMRGAYNNMKRRVVSAVKNMADQYHVSPYPVWDFSGYNRVTIEDVPEANDIKDIMTWYWEGSHYTRKAAVKVFERMFANKDTPAGFGLKISTANIEEHLEKVNKQRVGYLRSHQGDITELEQQFKASRSVR